MPKSAAIVGWSHTVFVKAEAPDVESLIAEVAGAALDYAGIAAEDVDAITVGVYNNGFSRQGFEGALVALEQPALGYTPSVHVENACATGSAAIHAALDFVECGRGRIALAVGTLVRTDTAGSSARSVRSARCAPLTPKPPPAARPLPLSTKIPARRFAPILTDQAVLITNRAEPVKVGTRHGDPVVRCPRPTRTGVTVRRPHGSRRTVAPVARTARSARPMSSVTCSLTISGCSSMSR